MIVYQSPGVYIQEVPAGPQPIAAAPTSVLAVVGTTQRGPLREPTRVTGWSDFRATFGDLVEGLYTAEAVYGYFENGGPAVHVVRVDPSAAADWNVFEADGATESFRVLAASPGAWANGLGVTVFPDLSAGGGRLFASPMSAGTVTSGNNKAVTVASSAGLAPGQQVVIVTPGATTGVATVTAVAADGRGLTLNVATAGTFTAGRTWLAARLGANAAAARLVSGSGIRRGDVVRIVPATRADTQTAFVESATPATPGLALALSGGPAAAVDAVTYGPRVERFTGTIGAAPAGRDLGFAGVTAWDQVPAPAQADIAAGHLATVGTGMAGAWVSADNVFRFPGDVPAGTVTVEAVATVTRFAQAGPFVNPTRARITELFGFVPEGGVLRLTRAGGTANMTRNSGNANGWTGDDPVSQTWDRVEFIAPADTANGLLVQSAVEPRTTDYVRVDAATNLPITDVQRVTTGLYVIRTAAGSVGATTGPWQLWSVVPTEVVPQRFGIAVSEGGAAVETFRGLALHPDHPSYYFRDDQVNDVSKRIQVTERAPGAVTAADLPALARPRTVGTNAVATAADLKSGFALLERVTEPAMVVCPDAVALDETEQADVIGTMVTHCEEFRRFAIVDAPRGMSDTELADWRLRSVSSIQAAVYAPWVRMLNLDPSSPKRVVEVPPSGFVAGVFARTDRDRGVHKAPANERVRGIVGLATDYTQRQQDLLNPSGVNLIRTFPGRGIRIWGARNATDDVQWRYVNVRRLFNLIEVSVERNTQWVVFEPNTASTWLRIRVSVENFLDQLYRSGALAGTSPEQAYRVRVGLGETMTETDIDLGLVVTEVAVAPAKPAEFVVFRFSHKRITE